MYVFHEVCPLLHAKLLEKSWQGHALHCTALLAATDTEHLASVNEAVAAFCELAAQVVAGQAAKDEAALSLLRRVVPVWSALIADLEADGAATRRAGGMRRLRDEGRGWLASLSALLAQYIDQGIETVYVCPLLPSAITYSRVSRGTHSVIHTSYAETYTYRHTDTHSHTATVVTP